MHIPQEWQAFRMPLPAKRPPQRVLLRRNQTNHVLCEAGANGLYSISVFEQDSDLVFDSDPPYQSSKDAYQMARYYHLETNDLSLAEFWYLEASASGHSEACFHLGYLYETRLPDPEKAIHFYRKAVDHGHIHALNNLALAIWAKDGPTSEVEYWLQKSHEASNVFSSGALVLFHEEKGNLEQMLQYAEVFFRLQRGDASVHRALGLVLDRLLKRRQFAFLHSKFKDPSLNLMKVALEYWYVLEILKKVGMDAEMREGDWGLIG